MQEVEKHIFYPHVSVDCVLFGYDGDRLNVLLLEKKLEENGGLFYGTKLPGRLLYEREDPNAAALSILSDRIGIKNAYIQQFRTFGDPERTSRPKDIMWLQEAVNLKIDRIVTIGYMALVRISKSLKNRLCADEYHWCPVDEIPPLAFDHNEIIAEALKELRKSILLTPFILYRFLPAKFTILELRKLHEVLCEEKFDVRNYAKKVKTLPYVVALQEKEKNVSHRAAQYYHFDKVAYNKIFKSKK